MSFKARVIDISENDATISTERGEILRIPLSAVHGKIVQGQEVGVQIVPLGGEEAGKSAFARDLLNELLKP